MPRAGIQISIVGQVDATAFRKAEQEIAKLGAAAQRSGQTGAKGLEGLKKPLDSLKASASHLLSTFGGGGGIGGQAFGVLKSSAADLKQEFGGLTSAWNIGGAQLAMLGAIGVGAVAGLLTVAKKAADAYAAWGAEVKAVQSRTGASAEDASRLTVILEHLGVNVDDAARAFQILGRNVTTNAAPMQQFFTVAQMARLRTGDLISSLPILQQKFQSLGTAQEKSAFVMASFGRGGAALRPLLSLTAAEMTNLTKESDRLGLTFTQVGIDKATTYKRSLNDLRLAFLGVKVSAGADAVSGLTTLANALVSVEVTARKVTSSHAWQWIFGSNTKPDALVRALRSISGGHIDLSRKVDSTASKLQMEQDDADSLASTLDSLQSATLGLFNANRVVERAAQSVADAQYNLGEAQRNLSKLQAQGAVDAKAVASAHKEVQQAARGVEQANRGIYDSDRQLVQAHRGVEQAERSLISAQESQADSVRGLADAQQSLIDAQRKLADVQRGPAPLDLADAQLRADEAATSLSRANQRLAAAQVNLTKVQNDGASTGLDVQDALLSVTEAAYGVRSAAIDQQRAQDDLNKTTAEGQVGSDSYSEALKGVQDASRAVEQASRSQRDATQAVTDAQYALVESAGAVEQAQYGHQQALLAVRDAQDAVRDAGARLREAEAGDPDFADRLAAARRGVAQAERALADARLDAGAAALSRADAEIKEAEALTAAGSHAQELVNRLATLRQQNPQFAAFFDQVLKILVGGLGQAYAGLPGSTFAGPPVPGRVPGFQRGGEVPGPAGRPVLAVVHGGERITQAGATSTVNIYVGGSIIAERDLADTVRRALIDQARRGG
jgi:hypothetical protein